MVISENGYIKISVFRWQFNDLCFTQLITFLSNVLDRQVQIQTENIPKINLTV